jgi:hypothetical protein
MKSERRMVRWLMCFAAVWCGGISLLFAQVDNEKKKETPEVTSKPSTPHEAAETTMELFLRSMKYPTAKQTMNAKKRKFRIILANDSIINIRSEIFRDSIYFLQWVRKGDTVRIYPAHTREISTVDPEIKATLYGTPADTCWLFRSSVGKRVNYYRNVPEFGSQDIVAIQKNPDGPIIPYNKASVEAVIGKDASKKVREYLTAGEIYQALLEYNR